MLLLTTCSMDWMVWCVTGVGVTIAVLVMLIAGRQGRDHQPLMVCDWYGCNGRGETTSLWWHVTGVGVTARERPPASALFIVNSQVRSQSPIVHEWLWQYLETQTLSLNVMAWNYKQHLQRSFIPINPPISPPHEILCLPTGPMSDVASDSDPAPLSISYFICFRSLCFISSLLCLYRLFRNPLQSFITFFIGVWRGCVSKCQQSHTSMASIWQLVESFLPTMSNGTQICSWLFFILCSFTLLGARHPVTK